MNRRQKIIVSVTGIFLVLLLLVGLTYAYFLTRITGNTNDKSISVSTANLAIVYGNDDGSVIGEGEKITPGTTFEPKTFTVTNQGNANTDYVVVIEDASVTYAETIEVDGETQTKDTPTTFESNDFTYTLTCESGCNSVQEPTTFPIEGGILVGNRLDVGETQTYSFTLTYNETGENQTNDMNKKLEAKINIKDITTINPYSDKPNTLAYNIINNAVALTNEEKSLGYAELRAAPFTKPLLESTITYKFYEKIGEEKNKVYNLEDLGSSVYIAYGDTNVFDEELGRFTLANRDESPIKTVSISANPEILKGKFINNLNTVESDVPELMAKGGVYYITDVIINSSEITLKYKLHNAGVAESSIQSIDNTLTITPDDLGISYYYRGNVKNNYLNFNNMCWRIVRIEGDGAIKMVLADATAECSEATLIKDDSAFIAKGYYGFDNNINHVDFDIENDSNSMKYKFDKFLNGGEVISYDEDENEITKTFTAWNEDAKAKLKTSQICMGGDLKTKYDNLGNALTEYAAQEAEKWYYDTKLRLSGNNTIPFVTLKCKSGWKKTSPTLIFPLTADEVIFAGGNLNTTKGNVSYLADNASSVDWWSLTIESNKAIYTIREKGTLGSTESTVSSIINNAIRPAISLIPNVELISGDGSITNPYVIG